MAKSNRKRKRERAVREARSAQKRRAAGARREAEESIRELLERHDRIIDPATPPGEAAGLIAEQYGGQPVPSLLADRMLEKGSAPERLAEIAQALLDAGDGDGARGGEAGAGGGVPSLTALTFASAVARVNGDAAGARRLLDEALAAAGDPDAGLDLVRHLSATGRYADAAELLEARLREMPDDIVAAERYGALLEVVYERVHGLALGECPCGLGGSWHGCCGPRERAVLERFGERSGLSALQDVVRGYAAGARFGPVVKGRVAEWLSFTEDLGWAPAERDRLAGLAEETAWLAAGSPAEDEPGGPAERDDDDGHGADEHGADEHSAMAAFAADPSAPAELAAKAAAWKEHIHYGLWRLDDRARPEPGLWCTEIVSCVTRYAEFPPEVADGMARWAVWLGGLVPVDGVWRCTGRGFWLSPTEADAAAELVEDAYTTLVSELAGDRPRRSRLMNEPLRFGRAEPFGVYADSEDPASEFLAMFEGQVTAGLLPRIVTEVHAHRVTPPGMRNTDGDEMCLISARITVDDGERAADWLARRTDFGRDPGDLGRVVWFGRQIPEGQSAAMAAEVGARLGAQGRPAGQVEEPGEPQRWIRGTLDIHQNEVRAEVNSRERLARLLEILARAGASPVVTDETRLEPAQDLGWPAGPRAFPGGAAPAADGWEKHWLDEKVPALHGRTPRQAAHTKERPLLEALLRQAEYEADLLAAQGQSGIDTAWLRRELDMPDDLAN